MDLSTASPILLEELVLENLVIEALDGADMRANDGDLRGGIGDGSVGGE